MWSREGESNNVLRDGCVRLLYRPQLSNEQLGALLRYKNRGVDLSITYRYVLSKLYDALIHFVPLSAAPNLITAFGFLLAAIGHLCAVANSPTFSEAVPAWASAAAGIGLLLYMVLDNLDGRQARRTGSSSPLGHLFDHACDALNLTLSTMALCASLRVGPRGALLLVTVAQATLLSAGIEEYITGAMTLRSLNGANEGILTLIGIQVFIAATGGTASPFHTVLAFKPAVTPAQLAVLLQLVAATCTVITSVAECARVRRTSAHDIARMLSAPLVYFALYTAWAFYAPSSFEYHARTALWTSAFFIFDVVSRTIVAHLTGDDMLFPSAPRTLACVALPPILALIAPHNAILARIAQVAPIAALATCAALALWRAICIVHQLCDFLNICCFRLRATPQVRVAAGVALCAHATCNGEAPTPSNDTVARNGTKTE